MGKSVMSAARTKKMVDKYIGKSGSLITVLQKLQNDYGYISRQAVEIISKVLGYSKSHIYGVITFYSQFHTHPRGKHTIKVCSGTACHVKGGQKISDKVEKMLTIKDGQTSDDQLFSFEKIACMGSCSLAPVVMVGDNIYGNVKPEQIERTIKKIIKKEK